MHVVIGPKMLEALHAGAKMGLRGGVVQFGSERFVMLEQKKYTFDEFYALVGMPPEPLIPQQGE